MTCELALGLHLSYFNRTADCRMRPTYDENIRHFLGPGEIKPEAIAIEYSLLLCKIVLHTLCEIETMPRGLVIVTREIYGHDTKEIYGHDNKEPTDSNLIFILPLGMIIMLEEICGQIRFPLKPSKSHFKLTQVFFRGADSISFCSSFPRLISTTTNNSLENHKNGMTVVFFLSMRDCVFKIHKKFTTFHIKNLLFFCFYPFSHSCLHIFCLK